MALRKPAARQERQSRRLAEPTARAHLNVLRGIPQVLERFGVDSEPVLAAAGVTRADLEDPERSAPFVELDRLLGACARKTKCAHCGLLLGQYVTLRSFGVAGRLARNAPSVGAALQDLAGYFVLHDSGGSVSLSIHNGSVTFRYGVHVPGLRHEDQVYDFSVAAMASVMRQLCGPDWRPDTVLLPRMRPPDVRPYREYFAAPLRFNSVVAGLVFPERCMSQEITDADPLLHTLLADTASIAVTRRDPMLHGDVRRTIRLLLLTRQCSRREVARRLGLHERSMGRRLQATGTTFQRLLDDTRLDIAQQLLRDTQVPVARVAAALGYTDSTVFARAFSRWTGRKPSQFRAELAEAPAHSS